MDFLPAVILVLVVGLLLTFIYDNNKKSEGRGGVPKTTAFPCGWDWLEALAPVADAKAAAQEMVSNPVLGWLGLKPGHRRCFSSGQWSFDSLGNVGAGEASLMGDVATAQKWNLIFMVSPTGDLQAYDEPRARALESLVRTAYGDLDFQWAFASRLRFLEPKDAGKGAAKSLGGFTDDGFVIRRLPQWDRMVAEKAVVVSYDAPKSISGLVVGDGSLARAERVARLKVAPLPFTRRGNEPAFYAMDIDSGVKGLPPTVQSLKPVAGESGQCEIRAQQYAVTNFLLAIFSQKVRSAGLKAQQMTVPTIKMVHLSDREPCLQGIMQPLELDEGETIDFTTRSPHDKEREVAQFLESFMHWSHNRTNGELMLIVDKGVKVHDDGYWIIDPEIYSKDFTRFGSRVVGRDGMAAFLDKHECNHLCERLITNKAKGTNRNNKKDLSWKSVRDSPKPWSARSVQSFKEMETVDSAFGVMMSSRPLKAVKCDFAPIWKALKRSKRV